MPGRKPQRILLRKTARDIKRHKTQFLSIFLMAFLAVFIYAGIGGEWRGLQVSSETYYEETHLADAFVMGAGFSEEQKKNVTEIEGVTATDRRTVVDAVVKSNEDKIFDREPSVSLHFVEKNEISSLYLTAGEKFDVNDERGIWLGKRFADANDLHPGDSVTLSFLGMECEKEIKGIIHCSEYVFLQENGGMTPDFKENGYAYLSSRAFPAPDLFMYNTLLIRTDDVTGLEGKVDRALDGKYAVYFEQKDHPSVAMFRNEIQQHKMMGDIFPVVFLSVALLTMTTTMTRIVNNQRTQIGTLKAMGFKKGAIVRHYVSYGFWPALFGAALGCIAGPLTLPRLFYPSMSSFYTMPEWNPVYHFSFAIVALSVIVLCTAVTYLSCGRQLRGTPAQTLRPRAPRVSKHSFMERTAIWTKLGFNAQWNLRDSTRNKVRSAMAIIGVLGCTALLVCAFGMNDSMKTLKEWQYEDINKFDSKLMLEEAASDEQVENVISSVDGQKLMESSAEIRLDGVKKAGTATITDRVTLIQPTDLDRNPVSLPPDGVSMSSKMANSLGVTVGSTVEWHIYGSEKWVKSDIAAIYRDPSTQGLMMTRETLERLGYDFKPTAILTEKKVSEQYEGVSAAMSTSDIIAGWDDLTESMMTMVYVLIAGAAVLSIVVLYNLGLLSFTEMERDMATLKVMGMKTRKLRGVLLMQNIWFSATGFILGLPCGIWLIQAMVDASGDSFDFPVELTAQTTGIAFVITFGLSIFVSLLFSKKIKRLNMVESLKAME